MRTTDIKTGKVYAVSEQRDAVIGSTFWALRPAKVIEKGVEREENEKGQPTQRTDGVLVTLLEADAKTPSGDQAVIRTREVKGLWEDHLRLIEENRQRAIEEAERQAEAVEDTRAQVKNLTHGILAPEQMAQVNETTLARAETLDVENLGHGTYVVQGDRSDSVIHVMTTTAWAHAQQTQSDRGYRALRIPQVNVIAGQDSVEYIVAAAVAATKGGWV